MEADRRTRKRDRTRQAFFVAHPEYLPLFHQARGWLKMVSTHWDSLQQAFTAYTRRLGELLGEPSAPDSDPPSRRAVVLAGIIAGVLSFAKVLGTEAGRAGLVDDLSLLQTPPSPRGPGFLVRPPRRCR
jgi:hypothetical protein